MAFDGTLWGRRVQLTGITPVATATGFVGLITVDNIPIEAIDGGGNSALNGGGDLRVSTDNAGANQIPLEVVSFVVSGTPSLRQAELWVRFPSYESANRSLWLFYNRAGQTQPPVTDAFGRNSVWSDYVASYQLNNNAIDSSGVNDGTLVDSPVFANGGYEFTGSQRIEVPNAVGDSIEFAGTISLIYQNNNTVGNGHLFDTRSGSSDGYDIQFVSSLSRLTVDTNLTTELDLSFVADTDDHFLVARYESAAGIAKFNYDNTSTTASVTGAATRTTTVKLGNQANNADPLGSGRVLKRLDVRNVSISDDRAELERQNQMTPGTFWTTGTPEDTGGTPPSGVAAIVTETLNSFSDSSSVAIETNITVTVTETLSSFIDFSLVNIETPVLIEATVTETLNSFTDSSNVTITPAGEISLTVTEILKPFSDFSAVDISRNIDVNVTETLNSFSDSSNVTISKEVLAEVTEILSPFSDFSSVRLPANWVDKPAVITNWTDKPITETIWKDK